jgi:hypothetical protein
VDDVARVIGGPEPATHGGAARQVLDHGAAQPGRRDPPGVDALAAGGLRGLAAASLLSLPTRQEAACRWHDAELSACCMAARSTNIRMLRWISYC